MRYERMTSPSGGSTLTTSAPRSARIWVAYGPITTVVRSRIRTPFNGPGMGAVGSEGRRSTPLRLFGLYALPVSPALAHLSDLALYENSAKLFEGFIGATSVPMNGELFFHFGFLQIPRVAETSCISDCTISFGVPAGAMIANQAIRS